MATRTPTRPNNATKEYDQRQISWWAEAADGYQGRHMKVVVKPGATETQFVADDENLPAGTEVLFSVFTPSIPMVKPKAVTLTTEAGTRDLLVEEPEADCLFWTPSAIEKFVFPYYTAHRLLTDEEIDALRNDVKSGKLAAILHIQPSKPQRIFAVAEARNRDARARREEPFKACTMTAAGEKQWVSFLDYAKGVLSAK